jgi:tetratricopeptide (TPR) repeat protein
MPTICLNMIVKNESKIIERLMASVLPIIDYYVICDTGSTDSTVEVITAFFKAAGIPGFVFTEPFMNFEHNRNVALKRCLETEADYVLLLDADMQLVIGNKFDKNNLKSDYFLMTQGGDSLKYYNVRMVRNDGKYFYIGATHEYMNTPSGTVREELSEDILSINDIGDGGAKADKFERDVKLLEDALAKDPDNPRYHFYLANSYNNSGRPKEAIEHYKRRIEIGGWNEEIYMSYYEIGKCRETLGDMPAAIEAWLSGYQAQPQRVETLYEITKYYRWNSKNHLSRLFYDAAMDIMARNKRENVNTDGFLFKRQDVYTHLFDVEKVIFALYVDKNISVNDSILNVLQHGNSHNVGNVLSNAKFYKYIPPCIREVDLSCSTDAHISSSSCIIPFNEGYMVNQRMVNYYIQPDGSYVSFRDKKSGCYPITTINKVLLLTADFTIEALKCFKNAESGRLYEGIEDVKIFPHKGKVYFAGTDYFPDNRLGISTGVYDIDSDFLQATNLMPEWNPDSGCEKNWVFVTYKKEPAFIYQWHPLILGRVSENKLVKIKEIQTPGFLKHARGSTCGSKWADEWYFVVHFVSYESPRHYYHAVVVLDEELNFRRIGRIFSFEGEPIEYCLGIIVKKKRVTLSYSTWDRTSKIKVYKLDDLF